jgi:hypothetical protein
VAVTTTELPPLLNENPLAEFATKLQVPLIVPELKAQTARLGFVGFERVM